MGRKKSFDEQAVLDKATELFWRQGYSGTTYQMLEADTGISGRSLINSFGDKDSLFCSVLDSYSAAVANELQQTPGRGRGAIMYFFKGIAGAPPESPRNCGCLMVNTLAEIKTDKADIHGAIMSFRQTFIEFFCQKLKEDRIPNIKQKAEFLVTVLWGCSADIRAQGSVKALRPTIKTLDSLMAQWTPG